LIHVGNYMPEKIDLFLAIVLGVLATLTTTTTDVRAGNEWNDSCRDAGYDDGQYGPFSQPTYDHCGDEAGGDDAYYSGCIEGCMDADNTRDVCEQATDTG
jgi:hypothetical protein